MSKKNRRINVIFEENTLDTIANLAKRENKSVASIVRELTLKALELCEDLCLSKMAEKLDHEGVKTYGYDEVWDQAK